jgi:hypothetical protein
MKVPADMPVDFVHLTQAGANRLRPGRTQLKGGKPNPAGSKRPKIGRIKERQTNRLDIPGVIRANSDFSASSLPFLNYE